MTPVIPELRHDWTVQDIEALYTLPLPDLLYRAQTVHRAHHRATEVQGCMLLSIKTGGCPEDCAYCPQSAHYKTDVTRSELVSLEDLTAVAVQAKEQGATRFCMGAAWRDVPAKGTAFNQVLDMVRVVRGLDMEACCTLGMLTQEQADALAEAGLTAYNHNLDMGLNVDTAAVQDPELLRQCIEDSMRKLITASRPTATAVGEKPKFRLRWWKRR